MKVGILGTARVVSYALIEPARSVEGVDIVAVASRSANRGEEFAKAHGIPLWLSSYEALLSRAEIEAVYIALPTALHAHWACRALEQGKHVSCEKPIAPNATLASQAASSAQRTGLVLQEGMHSLYLGTIRRQRDIIKSGALGSMLRVSCVCRHPNIEVSENDFRLQYELGGGAGLDLGCYAIAFLTYISGEIDPTIESSEVLLASEQVDRWMKGRMRFPSGVIGIIECGFRGEYTPDMSITVECEKGVVKATTDEVIVVTAGNQAREKVLQTATYREQLTEFKRRVDGLPSEALPLDGSIANARILDGLYESARLAPRVATV